MGKDKQVTRGGPEGHLVAEECGGELVFPFFPFLFSVHYPFLYIPHRIRDLSASQQPASLNFHYLALRKQSSSS